MSHEHHPIGVADAPERDVPPDRLGDEQVVFGQDQSGRISVWSDAAARFYGRPRAEALGEPVRTLFAEEAEGPWRHIVMHVLGGESVMRYRTSQVLHDGTLADVYLDLHPMRDARGNVTGVQAVKREPPSLEPGMGRFLRDAKWTRAVVETAVDGILTFDASGALEYMNPSAERMFGYGAEELAGRNIDVLMPMTDLTGHSHFAGAASGGAAHGREPEAAVREVTGRRKDGSRFPIELSFSEVMLGERRVFACILHDITRRKQRQEEKDQLLTDLNKRNIELTCLYKVAEALRSKELLSDIFPSVVRLIRPAFQYPDITRCRLTVDNDRYVSSPFSATPWRLAADITVAGRKRGDIEVFYLEPRPDRFEGPFLREERELIDAIASTIGLTVEQREADAKVIQASKLASIGEFAAGVAHEINNPVNGIMNCADIVKRELPEDHPKRQFAELIRSEAERIAAIVRNLLAFARQEEREHFQPAHLSDIVETVLSLTRKKIAKSNVHLEVEVPEDLPEVPCRSEQLQQVLMNLIINALHALDERYRGMNPDKILRISAEPTEYDDTAYLRLTVEDHGVGIADHHRERLFDPFFTTKGRDVGTGLGLSISNAIVRDHGGHITVESELGRYARFHVDLPLRGPAPARPRE